MKLYGSTTSPFVRRLRLWLGDEPFEFIKLNIFTPQDRPILRANSPVLKVPVLEDGEQTILDSGVIFRYLTEKLGREKLSWQQENQLTVINAANDSFIELFLLTNSGIETTDSDLMFVKLQKERTQEVIEHLENQVKQGEFEQWNYPAMSLYSLLDWLAFRDIFDFSGFEHLSQFKQQHADKAAIIDSDPRS